MFVEVHETRWEGTTGPRFPSSGPLGNFLDFVCPRKYGQRKEKSYVDEFSIGCHGRAGIESVLLSQNESPPAPSGNRRNSALKVHSSGISEKKKN